MRNLISLILLALSSIYLESCSSSLENVETTKLLAERMNAGDTTEVRNIFADSVQNYFADSLANTFTINTEVNNILASGVYGGFYHIDQILESNKDFVKFTTKEFPGYLMESIAETDTLNYLMTYYFRKGKIFKTRTDTLIKVDYCYSCIEKKQNYNLSEFFEWLYESYPDVDSTLNQYYTGVLEGTHQEPELVLINEELQKEYFKIWQKEKVANKTYKQ